MCSILHETKNSFHFFFLFFLLYGSFCLVLQFVRVVLVHTCMYEENHIKFYNYTLCVMFLAVKLFDNSCIYMYATHTHKLTA